MDGPFPGRNCKPPTVQSLLLDASLECQVTCPQFSPPCPSVSPPDHKWGHQESAPSFSIRDSSQTTKVLQCRGAVFSCWGTDIRGIWALNSDGAGLFLDFLLFLILFWKWSTQAKILKCVLCRNNKQPSEGWGAVGTVDIGTPPESQTACYSCRGQLRLNPSLCMCGPQAPKQWSAIWGSTAGPLYNRTWSQFSRFHRGGCSQIA